jgi:glucan phosphoethanolaminetransferase (alkaline phosphatase superfamily)
MRGFPIALAAALLILGLPYVSLGVWLEHTKGSQTLAAFVVSVALLMWLIAMVARTWRRFLLIQFPILILSAVFAAYTITYDNPPGQFIAYVLATSSWHEVRGFFSIWQGMKLMLAAAIVGALYLVLAIRSAPRPISSGHDVRIRYSFLAAVVVLSAYAAQSPAAFIDGAATNPPVGTVMFIAGPLKQAVARVEGTAVRKLRYGAARSGGEEVHILIVGESERRDSWSVYGYQRPTTPYLDKLGGEAVFFQHAVADGNFTTCVVPILLTGMSPDHFDMGSIRGNLLDLAEEAGYSTTWLMNQDPHISLLIGVHADRMFYPPSISTLVSGHLPLDESLLPDLQREIERRGRARFIGLHVIGSHWPYDLRYPASFARFGSGKPLSYLSVLSQQPDQRVVDAYDNSVIYSDWFLGQVIEQARRLSVPATVTYISDHGEDLLLLDGNAGHGGARYTRHQFDIPAFIWMNAPYRAAHADKVRAIEGNASKLIRSHNVFYALGELMGIEWPAAAPAKSFVSTQFVPDDSTPVIAGGNLVPLPH